MGYGRYMDGCGVCMKYTLFFLNLLTFLGGILVVGLGVWIIVDKSFASSLLGSNLYTGAVYVLIGTGVLVSLISCFGCFGAAKEVRCMLVTYFIIVFLIFVTMLVGGILGYVFRAKVETSIRNGMQGNLASYQTNPSIKESWDEIQTTFKCCGIDNSTDWIGPGRIPESCCKPSVEGAPPHCQTDYSNLYHGGCIEAWTHFVKKNAAIIGGVGIGVAAIMLVSMVFSCALINLID